MTFSFNTTVNKGQRLWHLLHLLIIIIIIIILSYEAGAGAEAENQKIVINVGAILNLKSRAGKQQKTAMDIASKNFNDLSKTHILNLHFGDSDRDPLIAASAAEELIKEKKVKLLMGMETWQEAALVAGVANRAQIPLISFAAPTITPPLIQSRWPFLIRIASDAAAQMKCIADIVSLYTWKRVVVIYEDDGYGGDAGMLALLSEALQDVGSKIEHHLVLPRVSSLSNPNWAELEEMWKLSSFQSRVFILLQSSLATVTNVYRVAKKMGLVGRDSAWIITESITSLLDPQVNSEMEGTLGIKTYYANNTSSYAKFKKVFQTKYPEEDNSEPGIYALRAYDLTRIVTQAIRMTSNNATNLQVLLNTVLSNYEGLSGKMQFEGGEVFYSPIFQIVNIVEGIRYKELDFWRPEIGFTESLAKGASKNTSDDVGTIMWPGNLTQRAPKGWAMPTAEKPMIIGVPGTCTFSAFVQIDSRKKSFDGFCIQLFKLAESRLNYTLHYVFQAVDGLYDDLVEQVHNKTLDAAVGDFTILAERLDKVEFTQPYIESSLILIVPQKAEQLAWMFLKPLTWQMWAATGGVLVYTILVVWFLERPSNPEFSGPLKNQIGTATWFTFTSLFFAQREKIHNNLTKVVVVVWLFVVLIVSSSYTANLSSMLTIQRLKPNITDITMLQRTDSKVGLNKGSFVANYLKNVLNFKQENIIKIGTESDYKEEFENKNISAAFLELPYAKVFMNQNCKRYTATTQSFRFGGLGFIFQKGSPFARDFTKAILELLENGELKSLEDIWLTPRSKCPNNATSDGPESLSVKNFMGLYVISGSTSSICLLLSVIILLKKFQQHQGNASDESVWNRTVIIARFLCNVEINDPSRAPSSVDVTELTTSQGECEIISATTPENHPQASIPSQTEGSPPRT
ncbi:hypothetical protein M0R45_013327 [Rubus argutus]|uniref:Glutamate receptor n=1 Tax=Rubus argutus TaxID=59490 RepID=A0AAW1XIU6_RUBAR